MKFGLPWALKDFNTDRLDSMINLRIDGYK